MTNPDRNTISRLDELPNIGTTIAKKLQLIGVKRPKELMGKDPYELYDKLCMFLGKKVDPCIIDVFISGIYFMETGDSIPWWKFTNERKKHTAE
ncbi:MAG: helix-hairpin-helix domain-containing protein [Zetaproteobacteria bacterium]|nr:helix-hairpin-helix domain-containing protein [Zetaproteobacteria bacterium]